MHKTHQRENKPSLVSAQISKVMDQSTVKCDRFENCNLMKICMVNGQLLPFISSAIQDLVITTILKLMDVLVYECDNWSCPMSDKGLLT